MKKYWRGSHTIHRHMFHIVWLPKYRKKILVGKVKEKLEYLLRECAEVNGWEIHELSIQLDHVHMLVQLPPSISVSMAVQLFKGASSRVLRSELPEIRKLLWGKDFWADGYFSESVGTVDIEVIKEYVKNQ